MPWAFRQRIAIRKRKLTTTRSTLMRHSLWYRGRLRSSNAKVAFVRANFTAGRGHAWEEAGLRDGESRQAVAASKQPQKLKLSRRISAPIIHRGPLTMDERR